MVNSSSAAQPTSAQFRIPQRHRPWRAAAGFLFAISLAGCGGGGGDEGGGTPPPPSVLDAGTAYRNMLNSDHTWDLSGTGSDGVGVFLRYSTKVAVAAPYPPTGASGSRTELEMIRIIGPSGLVFVSSFYFNPADMALFGVARANGTCDTATSAVPVPANTQLGQSGAVAAFSTLENCTGSTTVVGSATLGWSVEADGAMTLFCLNAVRRDLAGAVVDTEAACLESGATGVLGTKARVTITRTAGNYSLIAKNY
jgi:hypothetical protein